MTAKLVKEQRRLLLHASADVHAALQPRPLNRFHQGFRYDVQ
jgi:hypothetical protein